MRTLAFIVFGVLALVGCKADDVGERAKKEDCGSGLRCVEGSLNHLRTKNRAGESGESLANAKLSKVSVTQYAVEEEEAVLERLEPIEEAKCRESGSHCATNQDSAWESYMDDWQNARLRQTIMELFCGPDRECTPTERNCKELSSCWEHGKCGFKDGQCIATPQGCKESLRVCRKDGKCGFKDGECVPTAQGCKKSLRVCRKEGKCGFKDGECIINEKGCNESESCKQDGKCGFEDGKCVATEQGCKQSNSCEENERCGFIGGECAATEQGCKLPYRGCKENGKCGFKNGRCVPTKQGCKASTYACMRKGKCGFEYDECVATEQGCKQSEHCKELGKCVFKDGKCVF